MSRSRARAALDKLFADHPPLFPKPQIRCVPPLHERGGLNSYLAPDPSPTESLLTTQTKIIAKLVHRIQAIEAKQAAMAGVIRKLVDVVVPGDGQSADMSAAEAP